MKRMFFAIVALLAVVPVYAFEVPALTGRVNDNAHLLTPEQVNILSDKLKGIESDSKTGVQVVVLTLPSLAGETIDQVRNDVFHAWKLGQAGKDNGVLLIIAPVERKIGIEVGYGLEAVLPDSAAKRIIDLQMKPHLKKGHEDWFRALDGAAAAIGQVVISGAVEQPAPAKPSTGFPWWVFVPVLWFGSGGYYLWWSWRRDQRKREEAERAAARARAREREDLSAIISRGQDRYRASPRSTGKVAGGAAAIGAAIASSTPAKSREPSKPAKSSSSYSSDSSSSSSWGGSSSSSSSDWGSSFSGGGGDSGGGGSSSDF